MLAKFKSMIRWLLYHSGAFLVLRALHRHWYGRGIRILYYHRVAAGTTSQDLLGRSLLTSAEFRKQLRHLRRFYKVISLEDAANALQNGGELPRDAVVITFDDGYQDNLSVAVPVLQEMGMPATFFVVSGALDGAPFWFDQVRQWFERTSVSNIRFRLTGEEFNLLDTGSKRESFRRIMSILKSLPGSQLSAALAELRGQLQIDAQEASAQREALTWDELRTMAATNGVTIGAHTVTHPILPNLAPDEITREIAQSVETIAAQLGRPVKFFAYPNGDFNPAAQAALRSLALVACTTGGGGFNPSGTDVTALKRLGVEGLSPIQFAFYLAGWEDFGALLHSRVLGTLRNAKRGAERILQAIGIFSFYRWLHRDSLMVLLYHGVSGDDGPQLNNLHLPAKQFLHQMRWLRRRFTPVSLDQALAGLERRAPLPPNAVLVTFDDAYRNNLHTAWPILKKLGIPATLFVPTDFVEHHLSYWAEELEAWLLSTKCDSVRVPVSNGALLWLRSTVERKLAFRSVSATLKKLTEAERRRVLLDLKSFLCPGGSPSIAEPRLTWDELKTLARDGMAIGSHTVSHALLPSVSRDQVAAELDASKRVLERHLGFPVTSFAYPNGDWNPVTRALVKEAGYSCAFTVQPGANDFQTDPFLLRRVPVNSTDSFSEFVAAITGFSRAGGVPPQKILEIGNYPPPQCGWAINTQLVVQEIRGRGASCKVLNINPESRKLRSAEYVDVQGGFDYLFKIVKFALMRYRFHTHVNAESPKGYLLTLTAHVIGRAAGKPPVMTFHGGLPQTYFPRRDSRFLLWAYRLLFKSAGSIQCNSPEIRDAIRSYGTNGLPIAAIQGFSPQYLNFQARPLPAEAEAFVRDHDPVAFCYVCFRPEYALPELLEAMSMFTAAHPRAGFIWLGFPAKEFKLAKDWLAQLPGGNPQNLLLLGNLDHETFLSLLTRSSVYVRPPECDGISASVLESLALGVPVVAAANGRRPPGVVTYRFADPADLCAKLEYVTSNYETVKQDTRPTPTADHIGLTADFVLSGKWIDSEAAAIRQ
jgi:peptidoglycan/xylan/chitin deacetylase (PgdA/CDA1 family)/glycosyltransferase involved in cell wall biosynthesis